MTHTYIITGMTCGGCEAKVKAALEAVDHVTGVEVSRATSSGELTMDRHVPLDVLQQALRATGGAYAISAGVPEGDASHAGVMSATGDVSDAGVTSATNDSAVERSWFGTYKPVLLLFLYIAAASALPQLASMTGGESAAFDPMTWMRHFMAGFFLAFSFFKMLDLRAFAASYRMYDVIAKRFPAWGYAYAFIEVLLGAAYLANVAPFWTHVATIAVMGVSIVGVLQTVLDRKTIQCACLGNVFDLPMSTVTIIEDGLMIVMAGAMIAAGV